MLLSNTHFYNMRLLLVCIIISGAYGLLSGQEHSFIMTRNSTNCTGLASCGANLNCSELPPCFGERLANNTWRRCVRQGCGLQAVPGTDDQVLTVCGYNCTDTPLPFG